MLVIGEKINASNSSVIEAIDRKDEGFIKNLAKAQADAGADFIDVNAGTDCSNPQDEIATMEWLVELAQAATDKPLCIDSDDADVIETALRKYRDESLIINSITAEPERLECIGSLAAKSRSWVVALAMGPDGIPKNADHRLTLCDVIMTRLTRMGVEAEKILFDPLVIPIAVDHRQAQVTLSTIEKLKLHYPASKTVIGLSNISYKMPHRKLINRLFLTMAIYTGLDAVIMDPLDVKTMGIIKVTNMLMGRDPLCREYLRSDRRGKIVD
jgi:5-methyltetrahydrofolate--homocysteine methyltransferase